MSKTGSRLLLLLLLSSTPAWAELEFFQFADKTTVSLDETFQLHVVVLDAPAHAQLELPSSPELEVLSRTQSVRLQYVGGNKSQKEQRYLLTVRATQEGRLLIPPALLKIDKNTHRTEAISLVVGPAQAARPPSPGSVPAPRADSDLFLQTALDKTSAYVGEQLLLSLLLYSRSTHLSLGAVAMPTLEGFLSENVELSWPLPSARKAVDGVNYHLTTLKKQALFALRPGNYTLEPASAELSIRQLFGGREVRRTSNALTLEVKPLPPGAEYLPVGQWKLSLHAPSGPLAVGQPVELSLTLRGTGHVSSLPPVELAFPASFRVFAPTVQNHTQVVGEALVGTRVMQYVVIPQEAGTFTLPPLAFNYFNPHTALVDTTHTPPLEWAVLPGEGNAAGAMPGSAPGSAPTAPALGLPEHTLHPVRLSAPLARAPASFPQTNLYWALLAVPLALRALLSLLRFAFSKMGAPAHKHAQKQRRRREKSATLGMRAAIRALKAGPQAAAFSALGKNMRTLLECKLGLCAHGLTQAQLEAHMREQGLEEALCAHVLHILGECERMQFGLSPPDAASAQGLGEAIEYVLGRWR